MQLLTLSQSIFSKYFYISRSQCINFSMPDLNQIFSSDNSTQLNSNNNIDVMTMFQSMFQTMNNNIQNLHNRIDSFSNSRINNNSNISANNLNNPISNSYDENFKDIDSFKIEKFYNKIIRLKSHENIHKLHLNNKTTPSSLFYDKFPKPMFFDDPDLINAYSICQDSMMKANMTAYSKKIDYYTNELNTYTNSISSNDRDLDTFFKQIESNTESKLADLLRKKQEIAQRTVSRPLNRDNLTSKLQNKRVNFNSSFDSSTSFNSNKSSNYNNRYKSYQRTDHPSRYNNNKHYNNNKM